MNTKIVPTWRAIDGDMIELELYQNEYNLLFQFYGVRMH